MADDRLRYQLWTLRQMRTRDELYKQRLAAHRLPRRPVFSVITPVFNTQVSALRRMLASVKDQTYPYWEHCLVDDGSSEAWIARMLEREAAADPRIRFERRATNGGIVAASNAALAMATGEFVAFLDHDDEIEPHALYTMACEINRRPDLDLLYSGLDLIGPDGTRSTPMLWPVWSPELLEALPYIVHLVVCRRTLVLELGGLRAGMDGAQDYDLALRVTERSDRIGQVPDILYHWRQTEGSAANNASAKPYAFDAGQRAVADHLVRTGVQADRGDGLGPGMHRLHFDRFPQPRVSIVTSPRSPATALDTVRGIVQRTRYPSFEVVVAVSRETSAEQRAALVALAPDRVRIVQVDGGVSEAEAMNVAAGEADGDLLLLLGADLEIVSEEWLTEMQGYAQREAVGAVGAKLFAADGTVAHAGTVLPGGVPHPAYQGREGVRWHGYYSLFTSANYSAVSGACLMTRRALFREMSGLRDAASVGYSDVDYCLRLRERGYRVVFTPYAELRYRHPPEPVSPAADAERLMAFRRQWSALTAVDPYYNQHFDQRDGRFSLDPFASGTVGVLAEHEDHFRVVHDHELD